MEDCKWETTLCGHYRSVFNHYDVIGRQQVTDRQTDRQTCSDKCSQRWTTVAVLGSQHTRETKQNVMCGQTYVRVRLGCSDWVERTLNREMDISLTSDASLCKLSSASLYLPTISTAALAYMVRSVLNTIIYYCIYTVSQRKPQYLITFSDNFNNKNQLFVLHDASQLNLIDWFDWITVSITVTNTLTIAYNK